MSFSAVLAPIVLVLLGFLGPTKSPPVFTLHTASSPPRQGQLLRLEETWSLVLGEGKSARVTSDDFVSLRRTNVSLPPPPAGPHVIFANGDRLPGHAVRLMEERLLFTTPLSQPGEMALPLAALAVLWIADPADVDQPDQLRRRLIVERRSRDLVWLRNGDQLQGNLVGLDQNEVRLETGDKEVRIERDKVAVLALNNELARTLRPSGSYGFLVLEDGTRLGLLSAQADDQTLQGKTLFSAAVQVPLTRLVALDLRQGKAVYLSDLKPTSYQDTPFLPGLRFTYSNDASVVGHDLRLGGSTYVKGLGMHSPSRITYALNGAYRWFEAGVGLDDRSGQKGSARIQVLVDGKAADLGWDQELTVRHGAQPIRIPVAGAKELTLIVETGRFPFVQGHVTWADARLIR